MVELNPDFSNRMTTLAGSGFKTEEEDMNISNFASSVHHLINMEICNLEKILMGWQHLKNYAILTEHNFQKQITHFWVERVS